MLYTVCHKLFSRRAKLSTHSLLIPLVREERAVHRGKGWREGPDKPRGGGNGGNEFSVSVAPSQQ